MSKERTYAETLSAFDKLIITSQPKTARPPDTKQSFNVDAMNFYLEEMKIDISQLSIIHVAGTKGKGSTCAFCESILRNAGYKTGLFTSPHLIDIRERIRINGVPISKELFIKHFWKCHDELERHRNEMFPSMATYFRFLTLICFQVFLAEKVDVAIIEVGLGGRYDATNVVNPDVVGITSIGYDHVEILGDTLDKIAWQKAGIMKPGIISVIAPQKQEALDMFIRVAKEVNSPLFVSPTISDFTSFSNMKHIQLGLSGSPQQINAALALCLCDAWINKRKFTPKSIPETYPLFVPSEEELKGLAECTYEGRAQIVSLEPQRIKFFLDGAHTDESIEFCRNWFIDCMQGRIATTPTKSELVDYPSTDHDTELQELFTRSSTMDERSTKLQRILIFNFTGMRDPSHLLRPLAEKHEWFDHVIFCPNDSGKDSLTVKKPSMDEQQKQKMVMIKEQWDKMANRNSIILPSINDTLKWLWELSEKSENVYVLVTGSFYLVGDFLRKLYKIKNLQQVDSQNSKSMH